MKIHRWEWAAMLLGGISVFTGCKGKSGRALLHGLSAVGRSSSQPDYLGKAAVAATIPVKFSHKIHGTTHVLKLLVYPHWVEAQIENPIRQSEVDSYTLRHGTVGHKRRIKFIGHRPTVTDLQKATFVTTDVDWSKLPVMAKDSVKQSKLPGAKVMYMMLRRDVQSSNNLEWSVYVMASGHTGVATYDTKGKFEKFVKAS